MKKFFPALVSTALIILVGGSIAGASDTSYRFDPLTQTSRELLYKNITTGFEVFRDSCKSCHFRGNGRGASFLHTESKSMRAWNRVFYERYPECAKNGSWDKLDREDLAALNDYLYSKAADTYDPYNAKSCG